MSPNSTFHLATPSSQPNGTTTSDVIVNIAFGIAGTAISAFTIYQGHRMWKLWRLHQAGPYEGALPPWLPPSFLDESLSRRVANPTVASLEERELGMISRTTTDSHASDAPGPVHGTTPPHEPSPQPTDVENMDNEAADRSTGATTLPANIQQT